MNLDKTQQNSGVIRVYYLEDCIPLVDQVCQAGTTREVKAILETFAAEYWMEPEQEI